MFIFFFCRLIDRFVRKTSSSTERKVYVSNKTHTVLYTMYTMYFFLSIYWSFDRSTRTRCSRFFSRDVDGCTLAATSSSCLSGFSLCFAQARNYTSSNIDADCFAACFNRLDDSTGFAFRCHVCTSEDDESCDKMPRHGRHCKFLATGCLKLVNDGKDFRNRKFRKNWQ